MRIALLTETVPFPLDTGGRIKTWHTLRALAREHEVHCHAFARTEAQRLAATAALAPVCASVCVYLEPRSLHAEAVHLARSIGRRLPLTVSRHFSPRALRELAHDCRSRGIDLVYCDHLSTLEYGRRLGLPIVHDSHNVEHRIVARYAKGFSRIDPRRRLLAREARLLQQYEAHALSLCRLILTVSETDAAAIRASAPGVPVEAIPIGVDASALVPVDPLTEAPEVLFVGALDWPPNADAVTYFLRHIWPAVERSRPDARLTVVGRGDDALRARLGRLHSVRFVGRVDEVDSWFARSRVMVVPIRSGSGMRVKILDAFARGVPVVSTAIGIEGIDAIDGVHALVRDTPAAFADATVAVLRDAELAAWLGRAARRLALDRYDATAIGQRQLDALRHVTVPSGSWRHDGARPGIPA